MLIALLLILLKIKYNKILTKIKIYTCKLYKFNCVIACVDNKYINIGYK